MGLPASDKVEEALKQMAQPLPPGTDLSPYYALQLVKDESVIDLAGHLLERFPEPGTVVVRRGDAILVDNNRGQLGGLAGSGTIDYTTRKLTVTFNDPSDEPVTVDYEYDTAKPATEPNPSGS